MNKKLGLLLLPLVPLSAIGVVEILDSVISPAPTKTVVIECIEQPEPMPQPAPRHFAKPAPPPPAPSQPPPIATERA